MRSVSRLEGTKTEGTYFRAKDNARADSTVASTVIQTQGLNTGSSERDEVPFDRTQEQAHESLHQIFAAVSFALAAGVPGTNSQILIQDWNSARVADVDGHYPNHLRQIERTSP